MKVEWNVNTNVERFLWALGFSFMFIGLTFAGHYAFAVVAPPSHYFKIQDSHVDDIPANATQMQIKYTYTSYSDLRYRAHADIFIYQEQGARVSQESYDWESVVQQSVNTTKTLQVRVPENLEPGRYYVLTEINIKVQDGVWKKVTVQSNIFTYGNVSSIPDES